MMLISVGAMLLVWSAFIWLYDPDDLQRTTHERSVPRESKGWRYY
jgi:hypothetical protein